MFFRESVGFSWSPVCQATPRKVACHLSQRAVLGQPSFPFGVRPRFARFCYPHCRMLK